MTATPLQHVDPKHWLDSIKEGLTWVAGLLGLKTGTLILVVVGVLIFLKWRRIL